MAHVFAQRLRQARKERGMTQTELGGRVGANKMTISEYECGHVQPRVERLVALANSLDCTTDFLCGLED